MIVHIVFRYVARRGRVSSVWSTEALANDDPLTLCYGETVHSEPFTVDVRGTW